jgi:hypothetical protein
MPLHGSIRNYPAAGGDGSSSEQAVTGPKALLDAGVTTSGVYWYIVNGWESSAAKQIYTDFSIDGVPMAIYHNIKYVGEQKNPYHPTSNQSATGTAGFGNEYHLANIGTFCEKIYNPNNNPRWYVGQGDNDGSNLNGRSNAQWIAFMDRTGKSFANMYDSTPTTGQHTGTLRRGDGNTSTYYWKTAHGTTTGVMQTGTNSTQNQYIPFEYSLAGSDPNHEWSVWSSGAGHYYNNDRPGSTTRWGWMGYSEH